MLVRGRHVGIWWPFWSLPTQAILPWAYNWFWKDDLRPYKYYNKKKAEKQWFLAALLRQTMGSIIKVVFCLRSTSGWFKHQWKLFEHLGVLFLLIFYLFIYLGKVLETKVLIYKYWNQVRIFGTCFIMSKIVWNH